MVQKLLELELRTHKDGPQASALLLELGDVLCDLGDYDKATSTYARALATSGGAERRSARVPRGRAGRERLVADARRRARERARRRERRAERTMPSLPARGAHHAPLRARRRRRHARARVRRRSGDEAGRGALRRHARRGRASSTSSRTSSRGSSSTEPSTKTRAQLALIVRHALGLASPERRHRREVPRGGDQARSRERRRVPLPARRVRPEGRRLGSRAHARRRSGHARRRERQRDVPPRAGGHDRVASARQPDPRAHGLRAPQPDRAASTRCSARSRRRSASSSRTPPPARVDAADRRRSPPPRARTRRRRRASVDARRRERPTPRRRRASTPPPAPPPCRRLAAPPPRRRPRRVAAAPVAVAAAGVASRRPPAARAAAAPAPPSVAGDPARSPSSARSPTSRKRTSVTTSTSRRSSSSRRMVPDAGREGRALHEGRRALHRQVREPGRGGEGLRGGPRASIPRTRSAIEYLRQMYEKRRDWEKLLGLERREAERCSTATSARAKFLEIAKLATERVKKPEVCIELWARCSRTIPTNAEALGALAGLYERAKDFDKLADVLEKQAEVTYDNGAEGRRSSRKLGTIYGDRLNNDEGAVDAWRALLALDPNDRKAQEALKKKYLALGAGTTSRSSTPRAASGTSSSASSSSKRRRRPTPRRRSACSSRSPSSGRTRREDRSRRARLREGPRARPQNLARRRGAHPDLPQANNPKGLANAIEVKLGHEEDAYAKLALLREVAGALRGQGQASRRRRSSATSPRSSSSPRDEQTHRRRRARRARRPGEWDERRSRPTARRSSRPTTAATPVSRSRCACGSVACSSTRCSAVDDALASYRAVYDADSENADALAALERLYRADRALRASCSASTRRSASSSTDPDEQKQILYEIAEALRDRAQGPRQARSRRTTACSRTSRPTRARSPRSTCSTGSSSTGSLRRHPAPAHRARRRPRRELIDLKFRLGQTLEKHTGDAAGALENYREILFLDAQHDGRARGARGAARERGPARRGRGDPREHLRGARRLGEAAQRARDPRARPRATATGASRCSARSRASSSEMLNDHARAFEALGARAQGRAAPRRDARRARAHRRACSSAWKALDRALRARSPRASTDAQLARELLDALGADHDERLGKVDEAAKGYAHVLSLDPADAEALAALDALYRAHRALGRSHRRHPSAASSSPTTPAEREALYAQMAQRLRREARQARRRDRGVPRGARARPDEPGRARRARRALHAPEDVERARREPRGAARASPTDDDAQIALMLRLAALRETRDGPGRAGDRGLPPGARARPRQRAGARGARAPRPATPAHELVIAEILEPLYRQIGDYQKLIGVHEVQVAPQRRRRSAGRAPAPDRAALRGRRGRSQRARSTRSRARSRRIPSNEPTQAGPRPPRARHRPLRGSRAGVRELAAQAARTPSSAARSITMSARVYENDIGDVDTRDRALPQGARDRPDATSPAAESLERLFRQTERYQDLSLILQRKAEILDDARREEGRALPGRGASRKTSSSARGRRSPSTRRSSRSTRRTSARSTR